VVGRTERETLSAFLARTESQAEAERRDAIFQHARDRGPDLRERDMLQAAYRAAAISPAPHDLPIPWQSIVVRGSAWRSDVGHRAPGTPRWLRPLLELWLTTWHCIKDGN